MSNTTPLPEVTRLASELIQRESLTPHDAGCQELIRARLEALGFDCRALPFGDVDNLWARHGTGQPLFVFAGHTDVVPPGNPAEWRYEPFAGRVAEGFLWGRGAADMKGGVAAMTCALEEFVRAHPEHPGSVALLLTSNEEGASPNGTKHVMETLTAEGVQPNYCILGEPSSSGRVGDQVRHGRRGSISFRLRVYGVQGHVAYPAAADNPIHRVVAILAELQRREWDPGDSDFPPTGFQVVNVEAGVGAENVIPAQANAVFNFRYGPAQSAAKLTAAVHEVVHAYAERSEIEVHHAAQPFITRSGRLMHTVEEALLRCTGYRPAFSTSGGTSDGRHIAPAGVELVELGPTNATIHAVDERIGIEELPLLQSVYCSVLEQLFRSQNPA